MLITRETDYAIRVVRALHRGGQLSAREIAERENMQQAITYKMLRKLSKAGVVVNVLLAEKRVRKAAPINNKTAYIIVA